MSDGQFHRLGSNYIIGEGTPLVSMRVFKSHYKLTPKGYEKLWDRLHMYVLDDDKAQANDLLFSSFLPNHLLWTIHYAYTYSNSDVCASFFGITRKTFLKYVWGGFLFLAQIHTDVVSSHL